MSKFQRIEFYKAPLSSYTLLPLRFTSLDHDHYVVTNVAGEYLKLKRDTWAAAGFKDTELGV